MVTALDTNIFSKYLLLLIRQYYVNRESYVDCSLL